MKISEENKKIILKLLLFVLLIGVIIAVGYLVLHLLGWTKLTQEQLQEIVKSTGAVAPLIFILISFLQVTFVPIPGAVTIIAGNYLFGFWLSFLYSYIGMLLGAMFAFFLGKTIGRPFANWILGSKEKVDLWIKRLKGRQNVILFFMFFLPFFPDDILCTVAGLLPISYFGFFIMQIVTRATSVGFTLLFMSGEFIPYHGWGLAVLAVIGIVCVVAFILSMKYSEKINDFFVDKINALFGKKAKTTVKKDEK
ncbi:MAG: TVP38/TMEM64 family protein [Clostridia bacterium]|nr:TVP38/TMEM64 family protein [Clostridia bacterium]